MVDREELKRRCREKRMAQRNGGGGDTAQLGRRLRDDPTAAMLQLGIDDPDVLRSASQLLADPRKALQALRTSSAAPAGDAPQKPADDAAASDDDEEAPPPPCV